jgi:hypothetical protein
MSADAVPRSTRQDLREYADDASLDAHERRRIKIERMRREKAFLEKLRVGCCLNKDDKVC